MCRILKRWEIKIVLFFSRKEALVHIESNMLIEFFIFFSFSISGKNTFNERSKTTNPIKEKSAVKRVTLHMHYD